MAENVKPQKVIFRIDSKNAPYVSTKPFHPSQKEVKKTDEGTVFEIKVHLNFELERLILGFGDSIEVLKPNFLRKRIYYKLKTAVDQYKDLE